MKLITKRLIKILNKNNWEIIEAINPEKWWAIEFWVIQSKLQSHEISIWLSFMTSYEDLVFKDRVFDIIVASRNEPDYYEIDNENLISELVVEKKSEFHFKLSDFILDINQYRDNLHAPIKLIPG